MSDREYRNRMHQLSLTTLKAAVEGVVAIHSTLTSEPRSVQSPVLSSAELIYEFQESTNPLVQRNDENLVTLDESPQHYHGTELLTFAEVTDTLKRYNSCPVTKRVLLPDTQIRKITECGHIFEKSGLEIWLSANNTCPLCRCEVDPYLTNMI